MKEQWTYNTDGDYWDNWDNGSYDSKELAIQAGRENIKDEDPDFFYGSSHFSIGKVKRLDNPYINVNQTLELLQDSLYDEHERAGENAFTTVTKNQEDELENKLNEALIEWMDRHDVNPVKSYFTVTNVEEVPFDKE